MGNSALAMNAHWLKVPSVGGYLTAALFLDCLILNSDQNE